MLTVATFNVNSINARLPIIQEWLEQNDVDVVCFQELKCEEKKFPFEVFEKLGYETVVRGQKSYNGVAIASKHPFTRVIKPDVAFCRKNEARIIIGKTADVWIINTYIPQGRNVDSDEFSYKLDFIDGMGHYIAEEGFLDEQVLWVGDMNVAMDERDVHDPKRLWGHVCYNEDVQKRLLEATSDMEDIFRKYVPDDDVYTFWDYRVKNGVKRNIGWRIDHIFGNKKMVDRSNDSWVHKELRLKEKPSDHTPLMATFKD